MQYYKHTDLKEKSKFFPRAMITPEISTFEKMVILEMEKIKIGKKQNLSRKEREALDELKNDNTIVIKPADKGGGIVIQTTERYEKESLRILNDPSTYQKLNKDPIEEIKNRFYKYLDEGHEAGIINDKEYHYLKVIHPVRPTFYHLPKIHKDANNPPGRPIISGIDSISSRISEYIDKLLQPIVAKTKAHLKDTLSIIKELEKITWKENYILVTSDVRSLYSNIPHENGIEAVEVHLEKENDIPSEQKTFILEGIKLILKNNYFFFNNEYYLQTMGSAMGTRFAPNFANLYMDNWEKNILKERVNDIVIYKRYIDDLFLIWNGGEEKLEIFLRELNTQDPNIKLDTVWSRESINFLDLTIFPEGNTIHTRTFFKQVDSNSFIGKDSCHLNSWLEGVPKSQYIRMRRNCSKSTDYTIQASKLTSDFIEKGYDQQKLEKTKEEVAKVDRQDYLKYKEKNLQDQSLEGVPMIFTYSQQDQDFKNIVRKFWPILREDPMLQELLPTKPRFICRGTKNLKSRLTTSERAPKKENNPFKQNGGFYGCGNCISCRSTGNKKRHITKVINRRGEWRIKDLLTCFSTNVIYLLICPCGLKYVGKTTRAIGVRIREHIRNIEKGLETHSVPAHFKKMHGCNPRHLELKAIKKIRNGKKGRRFGEENRTGRNEMHLRI
uniref:Reverse transcriptase domain-containing protein n=1 Tax=Leptobrachium leishanense TaxID=445787 RepID=A0A8C5M9U5_9ANUR